MVVRRDLQQNHAPAVQLVTGELHPPPEPLIRLEEEVMDLSAMFTNDQIAVLGCFGALMTCGLIAAISFHFGPAGKNQSQPTRQSIPMNSVSKADSQHRKAA